MKKLLMLLAIGAFASCNVSVDHDENKDSTSSFDSTLQKSEDKLERWGDSAEQKYKDIKGDIKERWDSVDRKN